MTPSLHELRTPNQLSNEALVAADGTIWSHACTIGQYNKGEPFNLDRKAIENFVRVFKAGYPSKVPVDYEHASTSDDPEIRKLRAKGEIPKAGEVLELRGVFAAPDFTGDLLQSAQVLTQKANPPRPLEDAKNFGLWMRWKPTAKALEKIRADEFSELSITWHDDYPNKADGAGQGPAILAVALTLLPFLDEMAPLAASRDGRRSTDHLQDPAAGNAAETDQHEAHHMNAKMLALTAAIMGKAVATEDEAVTELTALSTEVPKLRTFATELAKEFNGETDPTKIVTAVRELRAKVTASETAAKVAKDAQITTTVEATLKTNEGKLTPLSRKIFERELARELKEGVKIEETETVKALAAMPALGITDRASGADSAAGGQPGGSDPDAQLERVARELLQTDPELKTLSATNPSLAYDKAIDKAAKKINYKSPQMLRIHESLETATA